MNELEAELKADVPNNFRRLKSNELVSAGDFVAHEDQGFVLWEGPNGFRANSFVKPIYRKGGSHSHAKKVG